MIIYKIIASFFGIGFIKYGGGTMAAFVLCVLIYLSVSFDIFTHSRLLMFSVITFFIGVLASNETEKIWGKDSKKIVIDEVLGMSIGFLFLPINLKTLIVGFIGFRFFDIVKPLYIRRLEKLKNGWGVMMDDFVAGIYTNIVIQLLLVIGLLSW